MANRRQRRAHAQRIHTQTEISRRLWRASHIAQAMHISMLHKKAPEIPTFCIAAVFSYLADDLCALQQLTGTPAAQ